jgi:hypothetical protein
MRQSNSDLDSAVEFVIRRIAEVASLSGVPLTDHEEHFLYHLPRHPTNPTVNFQRGFYSKVSWQVPLLRDFSFERLCSLAKDAHRHDLKTSPSAVSEWKFAGAVLDLNNHPIAWLLHWAGIKTRPRWDGCLLVVIATFIVSLFLLGIFATLVSKRGEGGLLLSPIEIICGAALIAIFIVFYISIRKLERWLGRREIEKYRGGLKLRAPH